MKDLRQARKDKGLTQEKLAELTGIHFPNISALEHGKFKPTNQRRQRLEKVLGKIDWSETSGINVRGDYRKAERLSNKLIGVITGLNTSERKAIKELLYKYLK